MPESKVKNEKVHFAVRQALRRKGLTGAQAAKLLGVSPQAVCNSISRGNFSVKKAAQWSATLDIPIETFLEGATPPPPEDYDVIRNDIRNLQEDIKKLKQEIKELKERKFFDSTVSF